MTAAAAPAGEKLPARARLRRKRDFERVFRGGWRTGTREIRFVIRANDLDHPRLGLAVGRRVGNAVARNRLKRRLREVFRRHRDACPAPLDVVVIPQAGADALSFEALREQFVTGVGGWRPRPPRSRPAPNSSAPSSADRPEPRTDR